MSTDTSLLNKPFAILFKIGDLILLPTIYLYFTGYLYTFFFFKHFGIPISGSYSSFYQYLVFAFPVLQNHRYITISIVALLLLLYFKFGLLKSWGNPVFFVFVLALFPLLTYMSYTTADRVAEEIRNGLSDSKSVKLILEPTVEDNYPEYIKYIFEGKSNGILKLISENDDQYNLLFQPIKAYEVQPMGSLFKVKKEDVMLVEIKLNQIENLRISPKTGENYRSHILKKQDGTEYLGLADKFDEEVFLACYGDKTAEITIDPGDNAYGDTAKLCIASRTDMPPPPPPPAPAADLKDIFFDYEQSDIRPDAAAVLDENAAVMQGDSRLTVLLEGYTDIRGTPAYNLQLAQRRADATKAYLVAQGIDPARIQTVSGGETQQFAQGTTEEAYQLNNRVVFVTESLSD